MFTWITPAAALYAESQLRQYHKLLIGDVFGNPHSQNQASKAMSERIEATRAQVLEFFHAAPEEYQVIFTPNATGALRLVGESYPFGPDGPLPADLRQPQLGQWHPRVRPGQRGRRQLRGALAHLSFGCPDDALSQHFSHAVPSARASSGGADGPTVGRGPGSHHLFAYPAQSSFSGVQHALEWVPQAQEAGWDVLLDAAGVRPDEPVETSPAGTRTSWRCRSTRCSAIRPGSGRCLVRRPALAKLRRPWYAGETLTFSAACSRGDRSGLLPHHRAGRGSRTGRRTTWAFPP